MFRRENRATTSLERLTREIQKKRQQMHSALADLVDTGSVDSRRVYQVFGSFQGDFERPRSGEPDGRD